MSNDVSFEVVNDTRGQAVLKIKMNGRTFYSPVSTTGRDPMRQEASGPMDMRGHPILNAGKVEAEEVHASEDSIWIGKNVKISLNKETNRLHLHSYGKRYLIGVMDELENDTTPTLGGNLDANNKEIQNAKKVTTDSVTTNDVQTKTIKVTDSAATAKNEYLLGKTKPGSDPLEYIGVGDTLKVENDELDVDFSVAAHSALTGLGNDDHSTVYALLGDVKASRLTMATDKLLGRDTAATGAVEELGAGFGLSITGGELVNTQYRNFCMNPAGFLSGIWYDFSTIASSGATPRAIVKDYLYLWPGFVNFSVVPQSFGVYVSTADAGKYIRIVVYQGSATTGFPDVKIWESASISVGATGHSSNATGLGFTFSPGVLYWVGVWSDGAPTLYGFPTYGTLSLGLQSTSGSAYYGTIRRAATAFSATLPSPFSMTSADLNAAQNAASIRFQA